MFKNNLNLNFRIFIAISDYEDFAYLHFRQLAEEKVDFEFPSDILIHVEEIKQEFSKIANFNPELDILVAFIGKKMVGYNLTRWWVDQKKTLYLTHSGYVLNEWRSKGITSALISWSENRLYEISQNLSNYKYAFYCTYVSQFDADRVLLLVNADYFPAWGYVEMEILVENCPLQFITIDGIKIESARRNQAIAIWEAEQKAFRDIRGNLTSTIQQYKEKLNDPTFDLDLISIAYDKENIAGIIVCDIIGANGNIDTISVGEKWRNRGIGLFLLNYGLDILKNRNCKKIKLICEARLDGIRNFYEKVGFQVTKEFLMYTKQVQV